MLDGAHARWLGARRTEKGGDWWLLRYGALRYELRSWETQLRCKPCAVQLGKCSLPPTPSILHVRQEPTNLVIWLLV